MATEPTSDQVIQQLHDLIAADPARVLGLPTAAARWELFACLRGLAELPLAAAVLAAIAAESGPLAKVLDAQAQLWPQLGRGDEAIAAAQERCERFPSLTGEVNLARTYLATEQVEEANELAIRLHHREPEKPSLVQLLARVALEQGDGEAALGWYEQLQALHLAGGEPQLGPARARAALGEDDEAARVLHQYASRADQETRPAVLQAWAELAEELAEQELVDRWQARVRDLWAERAAVLLPDLATTATTVAADAGDDELTDLPDLDLVEATDQPVTVSPEVQAAASDLFGHAGLRPGQARVINEVLAGRDVLATMPTGAGKSLTYQLPAMLLPGITLVISPLIALMQDQVDSLPPAVAARTTLINSTVGAAENRRRLAGIARGDYALVYAAPERLRQASFLRALGQGGVARLVIDEAHCISLWGHDFRPDYLIIPQVLPALGNPTVLALTATATPTMVQEIGDRLGRTLTHLRVSLFRPNLHYVVRQVENRETKLRELVTICRKQTGSGIVYVSSRDGCEQVARLLNKELKGRWSDPDVAVAYHAGLGTIERAERQRQFMAGEVRIIVATVAFGMGVDKADVRLLVHLAPPNSLEAYAQESGRAGRDGQPATCLLLYASSDQATLRKRAKDNEFAIETLRQVYAQLRRLLGPGWGVVEPDELRTEGNEDQDLRIALGILERAGLLERQPDAPRELEVAWLAGTPPTDPRWQTIVAAAGLERDEPQLLNTATIGGIVGLSPAELEGLVFSWAEETEAVRSRPGRRGLCLRLVLPAPPAAAASLPQLLATVRQENTRRIARMLAYVRGQQCRHQMLAAHFGERIAPCQTACDICLGEVPAASRGARPQAAAPAAPPPSGNDAAWLVLDAVRRMPFGVGKTGLTKVLSGSITAAVKADRNERFGALAGLSQSKIDALVERLIADGLLARDDSEYRLLSLTPQGAAATADALTEYAAAPPAAPRASGAALATLKTGTAQAVGDEQAYDTPLDQQQQALLGRLREWRTNEARTRAVPPYIIAKDAMLLDVVLQMPSRLDELGAIKGFGPAKLDSFGLAILELVAEQR